MFAISLPLVIAVSMTTYRFVEKPSLAKSQATRDAVAVPVSQPDPTH
jgi:peptidoglycan/LPS O-acetylase OafA/YrhL